ncbi:DUF1501 domain-containing protein [Sulfuriferula thiophila]|uniref:DUF1501 domain-containing protein n=1 Tax=Sulfuriferula thiophila TaxID=1781211 RepID=UPI000F60E338|nr:DUF1501 domain-containing protein [Sulfuriferula thiophila]
MLRRDFLKALGCVPLICTAPDLAIAASPTGQYQNLLILIEFKGGNDGLNMAIPYADDAYYALRPRIAIPRDQVVQLDERTGLHPALQTMLPLWQAGELAVVQGIGYPDPNMSHFRAIEIWDTASASNEYLQQGWLSRTFAQFPPPQSYIAEGVSIGSADLGPLAGGARAIILNNADQFSRQAKLADDALIRSGNAALAHILKVENDIQHAASHLSGHYTFTTEFPKTTFGNAIHTASEIIANQSGVAVVRISLNGFDTHTNQQPTQARLLKEFADGVVALKAALTELNRWDSSLLMTYSEFGRRPQDNAGNGTDHGTTAPHFIIGGKVKGGLYGKPPALQQLENGNLTYGVDFRSLYSTIHEKWWRLPASSIPGGHFSNLNIIRT